MGDRNDRAERRQIPLTVEQFESLSNRAAERAISLMREEMHKMHMEAVAQSKQELLAEFGAFSIKKLLSVIAWATAGIWAIFLSYLGIKHNLPKFP